eukprot:6187572-Pleurochrysis_carterae.AAC.4
MRPCKKGARARGTAQHRARRSALHRAAHTHPVVRVELAVLLHVLSHLREHRHAPRKRRKARASASVPPPPPARVQCVSHVQWVSRVQCVLRLMRLACNVSRVRSVWSARRSKRVRARMQNSHARRHCSVHAGYRTRALRTAHGQCRKKVAFPCAGLSARGRHPEKRARAQSALCKLPGTSQEPLHRRGCLSECSRSSAAAALAALAWRSVCGLHARTSSHCTSAASSPARNSCGNGRGRNGCDGYVCACALRRSHGR